MTQLEAAMTLLITTFDKYAAAEGRKDSLSKAEVKTLLKKELPGLLQGANQTAIDKLIKDLDFNHDSEVDFIEFMVMVATVTNIYHGSTK